MPLMSLAATAIDQPKPRPVVIDTLIRYLRTDSLCLREEGHDGLAEAQDRVWNLPAWPPRRALARVSPSQSTRLSTGVLLTIVWRLVHQMYKPIMDFYENDFKLDLKTTAAIFGVDQTEETVALLRNHLEGC